MPTMLSIRSSNTGTLEYHQKKGTKKKERKSTITDQIWIIYNSTTTEFELVIKNKYLEYWCVSHKFLKSMSVAVLSMATTSTKGVITSLTCVSFMSSTFSIILYFKQTINCYGPSSTLFG